MDWRQILSDNLEQFEYLLRILAACICGGIIGLERSHRQKEAGIRTHVILAMGAAIIMIVSKYGFFDISRLDLNSLRADGSRVASNVVTGISFLGAGVIFVRGGSIKGLTTAAGIWATAGIGLALGAGMYTIGIASTAILILIQIVLHKFMPYSENMETNEILLKLSDSSKALDLITKQLSDNGIRVNAVRFKKHDDGSMKVGLTVRIAKTTSLESVLQLINQNEEIQEFTLET